MKSRLSGEASIIATDGEVRLINAALSIVMQKRSVGVGLALISKTPSRRALLLKVPEGSCFP